MERSVGGLGGVLRGEQTRVQANCSGRGALVHGSGNSGTKLQSSA